MRAKIKNEMRVLMFGWEFPPHISGGLGTACSGITKALSAIKNVEITFVVPKVWGDENSENVKLIGAGDIRISRKTIKNPENNKLNYIELQSSLIPYLGTNEFYELSSNINNLAKTFIEIAPGEKLNFEGGYNENLFHETKQYAITAGQLALELDFDVIHVHDWMSFEAGIEVKRISGKPLIVHFHSTEFDRNGVNINKEIFAIEQKGIEHADCIITVSNRTRDIILDNYKTSTTKIVTVYNAVSAINYSTKREIKNSDDKKTVTFLGRITMQKGPRYFIEAASIAIKKQTNLKFIVAGKGNLRDEMIQLTKDLGINDYFEFPGFIEDKDVTALFMRSDVFIMPSVSEPFGIVALEAMQTGLPVVVSKQSGVSEIAKNLVKVDYWKTEMMANMIVDLLNNSTGNAELAKNGQIEVSKIKWETPAKHLFEIYHQLTVNIP